MTAALSILIVEDERIVAKDLQQSLLEMGYDAFAIASSADDAMRCASERRPDVVLMDIRIKGERDGIEAADALRTSFGVPVVYLTAHADEATLERAKRTEPYGYLVKPVKSSELRSVVEVSVHKHAADRRLRERERWFSTTLRCIADAVVTVDVAGNVSFMNPVAEELTGMTSAEALGRPNTEVVRLRAPQGSALDAALATRVPVQIDEATLERAGLRGRLIGDSAAPVLDGDELLGAIMVFRDISERREAQRRLEFSDRLGSLGTMAAGVAHEVNNPLSVIKANSQFLRAELERALEDGPANEPPNEAMRHILRQSISVHTEIQSAASRIEQIVGDLKTFARPRDHTGGPSSVSEAIAWAVRVTAHELRHRAHTVVDVGDVPLVAIDETRLGQVLVNLLVNAALALPSGKATENEVRVSAQSSDGRVVIEVSDTGSGMAPEVVARVFEPFFTTRGQGSGTGLGLAICHGILASVGGDITVTSALAVGTTFRIVLPAAVSETRAPMASAAARPHVRGRVLVVDDEELVLRAVRRILSREHDVVCCTRAQAALELIEAGEQFDVILSDLVMPDMGGPEFLRELGRRIPDELGKVVFMTGGVAHGELSDFLSSVPNRALDKPFDIGKLLATVQELLVESLG